ncbi:MAG: FtsQ-type POTRA domain-containing protein [Chloroflexi bacterium]|nr:MAG: FtsQ-type POTRA domain-containing protein [Chloroflexota bacterium]
MPVSRKRRRRSEMRLGMQSIDYKTTAASRPGLSLAPVLGFFTRRWAKLLGWGLLVGQVALLYVLFTSPAFFVTTATIEGNVVLTAPEIYAASGIHRQSIFWLRAGAVAERIMALPNIKEAAVTISLPARVHITVVERRPEVLWQTGDAVWWVDQEGVVTPPRQTSGDILRIIDDDRQSLQAGDTVDPQIIIGALTLRQLSPNVSVVRYSRARGLTVATADGWPVYLGEGTNIKAKLVVLTALLADLKARSITPKFIDVRNPERPFYAPRSVIQIPAPRTSP